MKKFIFTLITATLLSTGVQAQSNSVATQNTQVVQQSILERNKANVLDFYELAFNQHKLQEAVGKHVGAEYLQHNPTVADGGQAFIDAFAPFLKSHPQSKATIKRVAADGDLVWLHVHSQLDDKDRGEAVVDIFRLDENGKIVEHWDVIQAVPEKTESGRGMF
ncbi:nuclear transport factor 2 family protein [Neisseria lisongii]|uniref:Nuclear transport factor 2 family protein n=1 Tax=Neisseria lisongii TaxID=2912188 RepID=A0AAW5APF1_9NEIS|nr:nuclear transport factor 2 family protein [Neisseria lisongii]MCF7530057.1 nuclear transport factor 2 family protein [Neisseria lisongii]